MDWNTLPSLDVISEVHKRRAVLKARLRVAEYQLETKQAEIALEKPRNTAVRLVGYDAETKLSLSGLFKEVIDLKNQLDEVEALIDVYNYHKDVFRSLRYGLSS